MKIGTQLFFILFVSCDCILLDVVFLKKFFKGKQSSITLQSCWDRAKYSLFFREVAMCTQSTPVGIYRSNKTSLTEFSNNDYLVIDVRNCSSALTILDEVNEKSIFAFPLKFMILVDRDFFDVLVAKMNGYLILPNSEVLLVLFDGDWVFLHQPYKVGRFNVLTWENYGNWSLNGELFEYYLNIPTPQRRSNLRQANLVAVIVIYENDTWNHLTDYRIRGVDTFTKQDFPSMQCVFEHLNISYTLKGTDSYGYYNAATGEFDGLVHEIHRNKADVSGCSMYFTEERYTAVDFIKMGNPLALRFIVRKPSTSYMKNIFWITFTTKVWIAILVIMIFFICIVKMILQWETVNKKEIVKQHEYTVSDVVLIALEALCQQGTTTEPKSLSGRTITLIFFGSLMFIYVSYSANIVVLLQSSTKINLQDLLASRIEAGGESTHYMKNYFESAKKGVLRELYLKKIYPKQYYSLEIGMKKLKEGNFAFHVLLQGAYEYILNNFTNYEICGLQQLPGYIEENKGYVAVPKRSPYKDLLKVALLKVDEYGLQRRTNLRIIMKPRCFSNVASFKSVGIYDCYQVFAVWLYGAVLAILIFILEKVVNNIVQRKRFIRRNIYF